MLASTTSVPHLLQGLERLHVPRQLVAITGFMVRYGDVDRRRAAPHADRPRVARRRAAVARARPGGGDVGRRAVRAVLRARRAGVPGDGVARLRRHDAGAQRGGDVAGVGRRACCGRSPAAVGGGRRVAGAARDACSRSATSPSRYPDGHRRARRRRPRRRARRAGRRARARTAPARRRSCWRLNGINAASRRDRSASAGCRSRRRTWPRSAGASASCSRTPTTSCSCRRSATTSPSGRPTSGCAATSWRRARSTALAAVGMAHAAERSPHHLSFGERRRVALATVLAMRPDVLVLDEPSSNLDPVARRELAEIVLGLDVTTIMVTHDLPYALQLCGRAVDPRRRPHRRRRPDARRDGRPRGDGGPPPRAAVRLRSAGRELPGPGVALTA